MKTKQTSVRERVLTMYIEANKKKDNRGGKRANAGRKKLPNPKNYPMSLTLSEKELITKLRNERPTTL